MDVLIILTLIVAVALIVLITIQPRQLPFLSQDKTSLIGKTNYFKSNTVVKILTVVTSITMFLLLIIWMVISN